MQLISAHAAIGLAIAMVLAAALGALGVAPVLALMIGGVVGWLSLQTLPRGLADSAERWLRTPK